MKKEIIKTCSLFLYKCLGLCLFKQVNKQMNLIKHIFNVILQQTVGKILNIITCDMI
jgi:hypothetical protein